MIPTCICLVDLTTPPRSSQRFDQLCALLGDGIIGTVWVHGMREEAVVQASVEVFPALFKSLGIGCARYLKVHLLIPYHHAIIAPLVPDTSSDFLISLGSDSPTGTSSDPGAIGYLGITPIRADIVCSRPACRHRRVLSAHAYMERDDPRRSLSVLGHSGRVWISYRR